MPPTVAGLMLPPMGLPIVRWIKKSLVGMSALLLVLTCVLWVRSHSVADWVTVSTDSQQFRVRTPAGRIEFAIFNDYTGDKGWKHWTEPSPFPNLLRAADKRFNVLGFGYYSFNADKNYSERTIVIPLWGLVVLFTIPPFVSIINRRALAN